MLSLWILSFCLLSIVLSHFSFHYLVYASSPTFPNREIVDESDVWFDMNSQAITYVGHPSVDIQSVDYLSNGRTLNATLWLSSPIKFEGDTSTMAYGMLIDIDSDSETGIERVDYQVEIKWQNGTWTKTLKQWSSTQQVRTLDVPYNYVNFYEEGKPNISLSAELTALGSPKNYKVSFYAYEKNEDESRRILDFTDWEYIPTPKLVVSGIPNPLDLTQR